VCGRGEWIRESGAKRESWEIFFFFSRHQNWGRVDHRRRIMLLKDLVKKLTAVDLHVWSRNCPSVLSIAINPLCLALPLTSTPAWNCKWQNRTLHHPGNVLCFGVAPFQPLLLVQESHESETFFISWKLQAPKCRDKMSSRQQRKH
jgi:hypothetical protein